MIPLALRKALQSSEDSIRGEAARLLPRCVGPGDEDELFALLDEVQDDSLLARILEALRPLASKRMLVRFLMLLRFKSIDVLRMAFSCIANIDDERVTGVLEDALRFSGTDMRRAALEGLIGVESDLARRWARALLSDSSEEMRKISVRVLTRSGDPESLVLLIETLWDMKRAVASAAATALETANREEFLDAMEDVSSRKEEFACLAVELLIRIEGARSNRLLTRALEMGPSGARRKAATELARRGERDALGALFLAADRESNYSRATVIQAIGILGHPGARKGIVKRLARCQNSQEMTELLEALARVGPLPEDADSIIGQASTSKAEDRKDVAAARHVLFKIKFEEVSEEVWAMIDDDEPGRRIAGCMALAGCEEYKVKEVLMDLLEDPDVEIVLAASAALARCEEPAGYSVLEQAVCSRQFHLPVRACKYILWLDDARFIRPLLRHLHEGAGAGQSARKESLMSLARSGHEEALEDCLDDHDEAIRLAATEILEEIGNPRGSDAIVRYVDAPVWWVRLRAVRRLGRRGGRDSFDPLHEASFRVDPELRTEVARSLGACEDPRVRRTLLFMLRDASPEVRKEASTSLVRHVVPEILERLIPSLCEPRRFRSTLLDPSQLEVFIMKQFEVDPLEEVTELLQNGDPAIRASTAEEILREPDARAFDALVKCLEAVEATVPHPRDALSRIMAIDALAAIGDRRAVAPLLRVLVHCDPEIRAHAARALGTLADPKARYGLMEAVEDPDPVVRAQAVTALGPIIDPSIERVLVGRLLDEDAGVRSRIAMVLGSSGEPESAIRLAERLSTENDPYVRLDVLDSLTKIGSPAVVKSLVQCLEDELAEARYQAALAIEGLGISDCEADLVQMISASCQSTRFWAAYLLGKSGGGPWARSALAVATRDQDLDVRERAKASLEDIVGA